MYKTGLVGLTSGWLIVVLAAGTPIDPQEAYGRPAQGDTASVLRIARSADGLEFKDAGVLFQEHAASPNLVRLRNGDILALFDLLSDNGKNEERVMAASISPDKGRSWSGA